MTAVAEKEPMRVDLGGDATACLPSITDALNQITQFTYDPVTGNLMTATDPLNQTTTIAYNGFGQPASVTDPLTNTTMLTYDAVGNLETVTDPLGNRSQRLYDAASRLTALIEGGGDGRWERGGRLLSLLDLRFVVSLIE